MKQMIHDVNGKKSLRNPLIPHQSVSKRINCGSFGEYWRFTSSKPRFFDLRPCGPKMVLAKYVLQYIMSNSIIKRTGVVENFPVFEKT